MATKDTDKKKPTKTATKTTKKPAKKTAKKTTSKKADNKDLTKKKGTTGKNNNLLPLSERPPEERKQVASAGGKASAEVRQRKKTFKEVFNAILPLDVVRGSVDELSGYIDGVNENISVEQALAMAQVIKAMQGDTTAFQVIRDTVGEKPTDKVQNTNVEMSVEEYLKSLGDNYEY